MINPNIGNRARLRKLISFILILIFIFNFFLINNFNIQNNNSFIQDKNIHHSDPVFPKPSDDPSELLDPFTKNFSKIEDYFLTEFESSLSTYDIPTYIRSKDSGGTALDDAIYSGDNLLLYRTLLDADYNQSETFKAYVDLKSTPLWIIENESTFDYGFVRKIDNSTGDIIDSDRYLEDNLMPIFLLLEETEANLNSVQYKSQNAEDALEDSYLLINSSQFYDSDDGGYLNINFTSSNKQYLTRSNLYAVLANFLIYEERDVINTASVYTSAREMANKTMITLLDEMWDNEYQGFFKSAGGGWDKTADPKSKDKTLDTNALGILALLEYWVQFESMQGNSDYYKNATRLFDELEVLWSGGPAYQYAADNDWNPIVDTRIGLEANALMMMACLRLFELNGSIKYYDRAWDLFQFFEGTMFDTNNNAYETATDNTALNLTSNLRLVDSYYKAVDIFSSTILDASLNISTNYKLIVNQDILNITCNYAFEKTIIPNQNITRYENITGGKMTFIFKYPNGTKFNTTRKIIDQEETSLLFPITDELPFPNDGYTISIKANSTKFGVAFANLTFDIKSGISVETIGFDELRNVDDFYQGQTTNVSLSIDCDYNYKLTVNITLNGYGIENYTLFDIILLNNSIDTIIEFNITALSSAVNGSREIYFTFRNGSVIYFTVEETIIITDALTYSNLIYSGKITPGNRIKVSLTLINFLPDNNQSLNLTFTGDYVLTTSPFPLLIDKGEIKTITIYILISGTIDDDTIEINMNIYKQDNLIKTEKMTIEIVPKFEIVSINFPEKVIQGVPTKLILYIDNNQESSEEFDLIINDQKQETNIDELVPGENRIEVEFFPSINPYEIGIKKYYIELEDEDGDTIVKDYFESEIQISAIYLILFYLAPVIAAISIILYFKNKEIKLKLLRR
jgi:hypothetical protein